MSVLNIGVVGCGEAAQILHLPAIRDLPDLFRVAALCDASPTVLAGVGASAPDARRYGDADALVRDDGVDVVLICNPNVYHAEVALAAMAAGKHVMIEKPMCMTLAEADALAEAEARHGVTAQIGYQRRYAPAFEEAVGIVANLGAPINFARVHDVIGPNSAFINSTTPVIKASDIPPAALERGKAALAARTHEAIGAASDARARAFAILLGLSSHDISAMRELIGMPERVLYSTYRRDGRFISAAFDYGGFVCQFETGVDKVARFDAHLEVYSDEKIVRVDYDTPYIRHQPAVLTVTEPKTGFGVSETRSHATRGDAFVVEWRRFHSNVAERRKSKSSIADSRRDLEIFLDMMALMP